MKKEEKMRKGISLLLTTLIFSIALIGNLNASDNNASLEAKYKVTPVSTDENGKVSIVISLSEDKEEGLEIAPRLYQGKTMLPVRAVSEISGLTVSYNDKARIASFRYKNEERVVELNLDKNYMVVNGEEILLSANLLIVEGRILLPIRDIQSAFAKLGLDTDISWNEEEKTVLI